MRAPISPLQPVLLARVLHIVGDARLDVAYAEELLRHSQISPDDAIDPILARYRALLPRGPMGPIGELPPHPSLAAAVRGLSDQSALSLVEAYAHARAAAEACSSSLPLPTLAKVMSVPEGWVTTALASTWERGWELAAMAREELHRLYPEVEELAAHRPEESEPVAGMLLAITSMTPVREGREGRPWPADLVGDIAVAGRHEAEATWTAAADPLAAVPRRGGGPLRRQLDAMTAAAPWLGGDPDRETDDARSPLSHAMGALGRLRQLAPADEAVWARLGQTFQRTGATANLAASASVIEATRVVGVRMAQEKAGTVAPMASSLPFVDRARRLVSNVHQGVPRRGPQT